MRRLEEASSGEVRQTTSIIAIGLVGGERLERLVGLPTLDADHWETKMVQPVKQDRRHSPRLEYDATTTRRFGQFVGDRLRGPGESYSDVILRVAAEGVERE